MQWQNLSQQFSESLFGVIIFFQTFFQALGLLPAPCETPLRYTLGDIDSRFEVSESEVLSALEKAEKIWEDATGKDLFEYDKTAGLSVRFVYDERQQRTEAGKDLQAKLDALNVEKSESEVREHVKNYDFARTEYEKKKQSYEEALARYNARVKKINQSGGATKEEQDELEDEYGAIQDQFKKLEESRKKVNSLADATNSRINNTQSLIEAYNKEITTFQDVYGGEGEVFDQGVYTGSDITVYQYDDATRLVLVLAHEMGHALGLNHVENSQALMYYMLRDQNLSAIGLHEADKEALAAVCQKPRFFWEKGENR